MRLFTWILSLPFFLGTLVFALQNRALVEISFWPFDFAATMPLSVMSIGLLIAGFLAGTLVTSVLHLGSVFEKRSLKKKVSSLQTKLDEKEKEASAPIPCPTILSGGRYHPVNQLTEQKKTGPRRWFGRKK